MTASTDAETFARGPAGERLKRLATYAAVGVATSLIGVKLWAWIATGSISMLASLVDSTLDFVASGLNLLAVRHALTPADEEHRFGHGKAEALAGLGQAAFIGGSAAFLLFQSLARIIEPVPVTQTSLGLGVMGVSLVLTIGLVVFQR
jgi:ferrous-iron efflux pump FieF